MQVPKIITHANIQPLLNAICNEPEFQCGNKDAKYDPSKWYRQTVTLEVPTGELAKDGVTTMALKGHSVPVIVELTGKEGFNAQGLEGKVQIRKELFSALMNMRDLIAPYRGRIVTR